METEDQILDQLRWLRRMKWRNTGKPWMAKVVAVSGLNAVQERKAKTISVRPEAGAGAEVGEEVRWQDWRSEEA